MRRDSHFDSSWPVVLVTVLLWSFILAITPTGQKLMAEVLAVSLPVHQTVLAPPTRPQVLVVTSNRGDPYTAAMVLNPRGYRVVVAKTAASAQAALESGGGQIGVVVVDTQMADAELVVGLARSLTPSAKLIKLGRSHVSSDVSALLRDAT
jgi:hypothetical protein